MILLRKNQNKIIISSRRKNLSGTRSCRRSLRYIRTKSKVGGEGEDRRNRGGHVVLENHVGGAATWWVGRERHCTTNNKNQVDVAWEKLFLDAGGGGRSFDLLRLVVEAAQFRRQNSIGRRQNAERGHKASKRKEKTVSSTDKSRSLNNVEKLRCVHRKSRGIRYRIPVVEDSLGQYGTGDSVEKRKQGITAAEFQRPEREVFNTRGNGVRFEEGHVVFHDDTWFGRQRQHVYDTWSSSTAKEKEAPFIVENILACGVRSLFVFNRDPSGSGPAEIGKLFSGISGGLRFRVSGSGVLRTALPVLPADAAA